MYRYAGSSVAEFIPRLNTFIVDPQIISDQRLRMYCLIPMMCSLLRRSAGTFIITVARCPVHATLCTFIKTIFVNERIDESSINPGPLQISHMSSIGDGDGRADVDDPVIAHDDGSVLDLFAWFGNNRAVHIGNEAYGL